MFFPFAEYEKRAREMTDSELHYAIQDAKRAAENLQGCDCKLKDDGFYWDEVHTHVSEKIRRRNGIL